MGAISCGSRSSRATNDSRWPPRDFEAFEPRQYDGDMSDLETRISQWFDSISEMTPENVEARRDVSS